jgi:hypothetical protein
MLGDEWCLSNTGDAADGFIVGMLRKRLAMMPPEWDNLYLTMREVWNDDECMRHLVPQDRYREKGTVCGLQIRAHRGKVKKDILGVRILKSAETDALLSSCENTSAWDDPVLS